MLDSLFHTFPGWVMLAGAALGFVFAVVMVVWMWRTRPSRTVPQYRRSAPDPDTGRYYGDLPTLHPPRVSLDGRRRELQRAM